MNGVLAFLALLFSVTSVMLSVSAIIDSPIRYDAATFHLLSAIIGAWAWEKHQ